MNRTQFAPRYTGARVMPFAPPAQFGHMGHGPGTCRSCGHPSAQCNCGCRECHKESKELFVESGDAAQGAKLDTVLAASVRQSLRGFAAVNAATDAAAAPAPGTAKAFIGGGCCVHISVEYAPVTPTAASTVMIVVADTEGTLLAWAKTEQPGSHYQVKENVITTKPGATVTVLALNATARIRWCEVFSC